MTSEIHSFHCNVDNGDAAIHLLVSGGNGSGSGSGNGKQTVSQAILVDGGKAASVERLRRLIRWIETTYTLTGSTTLIFDAVVVSTWNIDHYGGIINLVLSDLSDTNPRCSFFKYDGPQNTPQTILYSPYWNGIAASKMANTSKRAPTTNIKLSGPSPLFESGNVATRNVDFVKGKKTWPNICRLVAGPNELVGRELYSGTLATGSESFVNLAAMVSSSSKTTGVFCVGADGQTFDNNNQIAAVPLDRVQKGTSTIAMVAVVKGKAKHYFSGDSDPQFDERVCSWMGQEVPVMKLSGHGNITSATTGILKSLNPSHFICSTGTSLSQHHPRWELLVLLKAFVSSKNGATAVSKPFFHPTNYPIYLTSAAKQLALDFEAFSVQDTDDNVKVNGQALRQAIFAYDPALLAIVTNATKELKSSAERVRWAIDWLRNTWNTLSYSVAEQHPVVGSQTASGVTVSAETQILSILAILKDSDVVIDYINGQFDLVASTASETKDASTTLDSFMGRNWKEPGARTKPASAKLVELKDTAPGALSLPATFKLRKQKAETSWTDLDDEAPRDQYVSLLSKLEKATGVDTSSVLQTVAGTNNPAKVYYASQVYDDGENVRRVGDKGFDDFLAGFEPGYLGFKTVEDADAGKVDPATNLWAYYMSSPLINTEIELGIGQNTSGNASTQHPVQSISMHCGLFKTKADGKPLVFNTSSVQTQFNTTTHPLRDEDDEGCTIKDTDVVLVALDKATSPELEDSITVEKILRIFHMERPAKNPPSGLDRVKSALGQLLMKLKVKDESGKEAYRNALWCFAGGEPYRFTLQLSFAVQDDKITDPIQKLMGLLKDYLGIDPGKDLPEAITDQLGKFGLEMTMTGTCIQNKSFGYTIAVESAARFSFAIKAGGVQLPFAIEIGSSGDLEISISPSPESDSEDGVVEAVAKLRSGEGTDKPSETGLQGFFNGIQLTNAWIARKEAKTTFGISLMSTLSLKNNASVPIGFTYSSAGVFGGALILGEGPDKEAKLLPEYDAERDPTAFVPATTADKISIKDIFGVAPPRGIPSDITQAVFLYSKASQQFKLYASLQSSQPDDAGNGYVPALDFQSIALSATKEKNWTGTFDATVQLNGAEDSGLTPAVMTVNCELKDDSWLVKAHVDNFRLGLLYSHFPAGFQNAASDFLGALLVNSLDAIYTHDKDGGATSFNMSGVVSFGGLELHLTFQYVGSKLGQGKTAAELEKDGADADSPLKKGDVVVKKAPPTDKPAEWSFDAVMGSAAGQTTNIRNILDSIDGSLSNFLPGFVLDTEIAPADGDRPPVILSLSTIALQADGEEKEDSYLMLQAFIEIGDLNLTFIQMSNKKNDADIPKPGQAPGQPKKGENAVPKRILRFALSKLPLVQNIPLVGQLPQPFDDLEYVWVAYPEDGKPGTTGESDSSNNAIIRGFSMQELDQINKNLEEKKIPTIKYKQTGSKAGTKASPKADNTKTIALAAGQHFIITHNGEAVVDYVFGSKKKAPNTVVARRGIVAEDGAAEPEEAPDAKPVKKGALGTKIGPLSIANIGLKVENTRLYLVLDATFELGPITFALLGFGIGFAIFELKNLSKDSMISLAKSIDLKLHGMELSFNQPPITLAGVFIHNDSNGVNSYAGGVAVGFVPYLFVAVGEYDEIDRTVNNIAEKYKSMFLYAKLDGPLITLAFASIEGVRLGFGVNSNVRQPRIEELSEFPFINDKAADDGGVNLLAILQNMQAWITPKKETYWGAAGLKVKAFEVLEVTAVMLLQFSSKGCDIAIYGDAVARMPPDAEPNATIIYLELDFAIILAFTEGMMCVQAALAPTSHILVPQCQLTGGFALCYWFSPSPYTGDWVFSAGGYHRAFQPPPHYPVPKRIGISFQVGRMISVTGEAYFAVCPKAVMGGGNLHIQIDIGPVSAWSDSRLDCLIMFKPFHYMISVGISVGVSFNIDAWIIHIHVKASIDADLSIAGPPFGGTAYVDFHLFGFSIDFGARPDNLPPIKFPEFLEMVQRPGPETGKPPSAEAGTVQDPNSPEAQTLKTMANLHITLEDGNFTSEEGPKGKDENPQKLPANDPFTEWRVRAGSVKFRIGCDFALKSYNVSSQGEVTVLDPRYAIKDDVYANPMHLRTPVHQSALAVTIVNAQGTVTGWRCEPIVKAVPKALWRQYDEATDPVSKTGGNHSKDLLDGTDATTNQAMGISVLAPFPVLSQDLIPEFLALAVSSENVNDTNPLLEKTDIPALTPWNIFPVPDDQTGDLVAKWRSVATAWKAAPAVQPSTAGGAGAAAAAGDTEISEMQSMLGACASALGWDVPSAETLALLGVRDAKDLPAPRPWELSAEVPGLLLQEGRFESAFLTLPMLEVGA